MKAVVLLSGGMDSAVCLFMAVKDFGPEAVKAIFFDWRQLALYEERLAAFNLARKAGTSKPSVIKLDFPYGGNLTDPTARMALDRKEEEILEGEVPDTFFPGRNSVMLAYAFGYAAALGSRQVYFGANADDCSGYPDCRPEFLDMAAQTFNAGLLKDIELVTPVLRLDKRGIVEAGESLGVPWESTFSCYSPKSGRACARCDACVLREAALKGR